VRIILDRREMSVKIVGFLSISTYKFRNKKKIISPEGRVGLEICLKIKKVNIQIMIKWMIKKVQRLYPKQIHPLI